jgi:hypothetical protein
MAKKMRGDYSVYPFAECDGHSIFRYYLSKGTVNLEIDPFGVYLGDSKPCIWISRDVAADFFDRADTANGNFGTHVCFEDSGETVSLYDATEERARRCSGSESSIFLMHQIPFLGRSRAGLERELEDVFRTAKRLRG